MTISLTALAWIGALLLDRFLRLPPLQHPLAHFRRLAQCLENAVYSSDGLSPSKQRLHGSLLLLVLAIMPAVLLGALAAIPYVGIVVDIAVLYLALDIRSLTNKAQILATLLTRGEMEQARAQTALLTACDTDSLDETQISRAALESILVQSHVTVFGPLFWYLMLGTTGVGLYRLVTVLAGLWAHPTPRYHAFGWATVHLQWLLDWLPARLTACSYGLLGHSGAAWRCWQLQARFWQDRNDGVVLATGAGALGLQLGGISYFFGTPVMRITLGEGLLPGAADISRTVGLLYRCLFFWTGLLLLAALFEVLMLWPSVA